jgi:Zn-dependent peptidase ImmA (M78 family)
MVDRLDPLTLADLLGATVVSIPELIDDGASPVMVRHLMRSGDISAATLRLGIGLLIVFNPNQPPGRLANSIAHESSHIILKHEASEVFGDGACRKWNGEEEEEADWLAGALLIPSEAALAIVRNDTDYAVAAQHFGTSVPLLRWRINQTGAAIRVQRERAWRSTPMAKRV